ncbi:Helix-turn-helix domain protein [Oceanobacillus picturae]|uniref:Helix-turn-helix domain protein n=1 Tax=Oceanobacillus picturae TaxID=171693 RepID=W9AQQ8_9BACI|nr:helix-turn-helix domain-containing protein [Oceanobacillus picturae]CDO05227.1 Helix-turn-helix domain protein [Oceanobacillus picturae]
MDVYTVDQALELLKKYKITTHKESLRRWLRNGRIKGISPTSRKEGWRINEEDLWRFIQSQLPEDINLNQNTTNVVKESENKESVRAEMWWEIVSQNVFQGFVDVKKKQIWECIEHNGHSKEFGEYVWAELQDISWYAQPRIPYLLDACLFDGKRIKLDDTYGSLEEQIFFPVIEEIRKKRIAK